MKFNLLTVSGATAIFQLIAGANVDTHLAARAEEVTPAETIAAQIRDQGFPCDGSLAAERDVEYSEPDEPVWILKCANATYRVRLFPIWQQM